VFYPDSFIQFKSKLLALIKVTTKRNQQ